jgi:CheY-like chemotaxis protein
MQPKITVVEDEEALSVLLRYNLEAEGYEVETILRGDEADIRLQEQVPDLLILDWMLPGVPGIELCRRLRARPTTERLPIIMLTARGEESERIRGLSTGADGIATGSTAGRAKSVSGRRNSACWNSSCRRPAAFSRARSFSMASGAMTSTSMSAPWTCILAACARH